MLLLRGYLVVAVLLLIVKTVQLGPLTSQAPRPVASAPGRLSPPRGFRDGPPGGGGSSSISRGTVTGCRPRLRRPAMIAGSAAIVSERSPPASCMRMIAPGWAPASARCTIAATPGRV